MAEKCLTENTPLSSAWKTKSASQLRRKQRREEARLAAAGAPISSCGPLVERDRRLIRCLSSLFVEH